MATGPEEDEDFYPDNSAFDPVEEARALEEANRLERRRRANIPEGATVENMVEINDKLKTELHHLIDAIENQLAKIRSEKEKQREAGSHIH